MARRRWRTIVVLVVAVVGGAAAIAGSQSPAVVYSGLSAQRLAFSLTAAAGDETLSLDVLWMASCGRVVRTSRAAVTTIADNGEFAWSGTHVNELDDGDEDRQRLSLVGRREGDGTLTGVWRGERDAYNGQGQRVDRTCSSGDVAFRVSRDGSTRQPAPQLDGAGHLVVGLAEEPDLVAVGGGRTWVRGRTASGGPSLRPATIVTAVDQQTGLATPTQLDDVGDATVDLAAGEGAAWLLRRDRADTRLLRIDAGTRRVVRGPRLLARGDDASPTGLAVAGGGVWVLLVDGRVLRADAGDGGVVRSISVPVDRRMPAQRRCRRGRYAPLMASHRHAIWVMSRTLMSCRSHASPRAFALARKGPFFSLTRIDARTNRVTRTVALTREYSSLAAGPSGVWAIGCLKPAETYRCRRAAVQRIDLRSGKPAAVVALPPAHSSLRTAQLIGPIGVGRGAVWVVQPADPGSSRGYFDEPPGVLQRIDVADPRPKTVRAIARLPTDLTVDERGAWVLDGVDRALIRIQP